MTTPKAPAKRRPLNKAELLPLSGRDAQRLSLKHHLALAALRTGHADVAPIGTLLNVVYLAFLLRSPGDERFSPYRDAEAALNELADRLQRDEAAQLSEHAMHVLEQIVLQHDAQLATVRKYRVVDAWSRVAQIFRSDGLSPIPTAE